jgi:ATP-dependent Clp protease protease subunit
MSIRDPFRRRGPLRASLRASGDDEMTLFIYDDIAPWGIMAKDLVPEIAALTAGTIHVRINSQGGDVMDGVAIYNALRSQAAKVVAHVDALAASIASLIAMAGDEILIAENAMLMIHDPWGITIGNAADHRKTADLLDKTSEATLIRAYMAQTEQPEAEIKQWMADETWFTAEEAVEAGFADAIEAAAGVAAHVDAGRFRNAPARLTAPAGEPTLRELERALRDAGLSRSRAAAGAVAALEALGGQRDADHALLEGLGQLTLLVRS